MLNAMDFECPACGAKPGERCQTMVGKAMQKPHAKRQRAALDKEYPPDAMKAAAARAVTATRLDPGRGQILNTSPQQPPDAPKFTQRPVVSFWNFWRSDWT